MTLSTTDPEFRAHAARRMGTWLLALVPLAACGPPGAVADDGDITYEPNIPASIVNLGVCHDGTQSNDPAQLEAGADQIGRAVRAAIEPGDGAPIEPERRAARDPIPGLRLVVRRVTGSGTDTPADVLLDETVAGVDGLVAPPDPSDIDHFASDNAAWTAARDQSNIAITAAQEARTDLLARFAALDGSTTEDSAIATCLSGLRNSFAPGNDLIAVIVSDLDQTGAPQFRGDFATTRVVIAHTCVDADACDRQQGEWIRMLDEVDVADRQIVAVGQLAAVLAPMLEVR